MNAKEFDDMNSVEKLRYMITNPTDFHIDDWLGDLIDLALDVCKQLEAAEKENKALRRPTESAGFNSDGLLAVGNELIAKDNTIKQQAEEIVELKDYKIFVKHIQSHLTHGQYVICKICGKSFCEIVLNEQALKGKNEQEQD